MADRSKLYAFLAGVETFHALVHAYFSITRADIEHPAELVGIKVTPRLHAVAAVVNAAIAFGLGARAFQSARTLRVPVGRREVPIGSRGSVVAAGPTS